MEIQQLEVENAKLCSDHPTVKQEIDSEGVRNLRNYSCRNYRELLKVMDIKWNCQGVERLTQLV